jgi:general stress protein 26
MSMKKKINRRKLENIICDFLRTQATCVIATCSDSIPRASTVEFFPTALTIYIITEGGRKVENIKKNPRVSIALSAPFTGWESLKGLQMSGTAEIGRKGSQIFEEGIKAYKKRKDLEKVLMPDFMNVLKIIPFEIDYIDAELEKKGYEFRQSLSFL